MAENKDAMIKKDRMRFIKNKMSSNLILLAIVANALYFVSIYRSDVGNYYYKIFIGASIVYNLVFMLTAFLSSEGVKNYNISIKKRGEELIFLRKIVRGAADDSYGIEVAKLAGLPETVISKAKGYLRELESAPTVTA